MPEMLPNIPKRFETERLYLRSYEAGDGAWYYAAGQRNRLHLMRYEAANVLLSAQSAEEAERIVQELEAEWEARRCFFLGAFEKATGRFVAQLYVGPVNLDLPEFALGYVVDKDHEGRGFASEALRMALRFAFVYLGAHRVSVECDDTNQRSARVAERCGMFREAHFRENKRHADGTISGTLHYGLLRSEFEAV